MYVTDGAITYYYGKEGTSFYGFLGSTRERYWELEKCDVATNGLTRWTKSTGDNVRYLHGDMNYPMEQTILSYANSYTYSLMNEADRKGMIQKDVFTGYEKWADRLKGDVSGLKAYMWAPSAEEYEANKTIGRKLRTQVWTRSFYPYVDASSHWYYFASALNWDEVTGETGSAGATNYGYVYPAFDLDLTKVMMCKRVS